jgi:hypothetical protein
MLVLSTNLIIHTCIDLGSIKLSLNKTSGTIKSEFTCCSNSFARALVIGPILISLDFFAATSSSSIGAGDNGGVIGMSSSPGAGTEDQGDGGEVRDSREAAEESREEDPSQE